MSRPVVLGKEGGPSYIIVEPLEGCDLQHFLEASGPLPVQDAIDYIVQACVATAHAHACGMVHADLQPASLFLTRRADGAPLVKVLDFGAPEAVGQRPTLVEPSRTWAWPSYMSPERLRGVGIVDSRADVWSLGGILHFLLTGQAPFAGQSLPELVSAIAEAQPRSLTSLRKDAPPQIAAIVRRCLEGDPGARIPSVLELARVLAPWARPETSVLVSEIAGTQKSAAPAPRVPASAEDTFILPRSRRMFRWPIGVALAFAALLPLGFYELSSRAPAAPRPQTFPAEPSAAEPVPAPPPESSTELPPASGPTESARTIVRPPTRRAIVKTASATVESAMKEAKTGARGDAPSTSQRDLRSLFDERL